MRDAATDADTDAGTDVGTNAGTNVAPPAPARPAKPSSGPRFEAAAQLVLKRVQSAFSAMMDEARCDAVQSAADVKRALGLDKKLGWQVYRVINAPNAIAAGFAVPSSASTKRLASAARKRGVSKQVATRMEEAVAQFERFVREHADDRTEFESMIADWSPEGRETIDFLNRRAAFGALGRLRGAAMETAVNAIISYPSANPNLVDSVFVDAFLGLRRLRATACIGAGFIQSSNPATESSMRTLDDQALSDPTGILLQEFCSKPSPEFETRRSSTGLMDFWLSGAEVGLRTAIDLVFGLLRRQVMPRYQTPERPTAFNFCIPFTPSRRLIFDAIVHKDLLPAIDPQVLVHETAGNGSVGTHDAFANRRNDLLDWRPTVRPLGPGIEQFRAAWVPRYVEVLEHVCERTGWDPSVLRGYRIEVEYPVPSWQYSLIFEKYPAPTA